MKVPLLLLLALTSCSQSSFRGSQKSGDAVIPKDNGIKPSAASPAAESSAAPEATEAPSPVPLPSGSVPAQPTRDLVFGGGEEGAFHLGDGAFNVSSCQDRLSSSSVAGISFEFHFRLDKTTTLNTLDIADLCGVTDLAGKGPSFLELKNSRNEVLYTTGIFENSNGVGIQFGPISALPPGDYMLIVTSGFMPPHPDLPAGDYDDFIVGRVEVRADAPVTRLGVITRGRSGEIIRSLP